MNTKNIFKTLFMAVLLLVGTNKAMAQNTVLYSNENGQDLQSGSTYDFNLGNFTNAKAGDILRVWGVPYDAPSEWNWAATPHKIEIQDRGWTTVFSKTDGFDATLGYYDFTLSQNNIDKFNATEPVWYNYCGRILGEWFRLYKVEIVPGSGSTPEPTTHNITITASNGTITANPTNAAEGETITLTIAPDNGYELQSISAVAGGQPVALNGSGNTRTFTMPACDVTVTGNFIKERQYVSASIPSAGYATFCSTEPLDFSGITTLKAYYATAVSDTEVTFKQVTGTVAAGTGLLLVGTTSQVLVAEAGNECTGNLLVGVLGNDEIVNAANKYVLVVKDGEVKFADTAAQAATVPVGKAYLQAPSNSRILTFSFDGEATGISAVNTVESQKLAVYNLQGQRVTTMNKGLYIINGKKVMIK
ncbi:MAG: hypothetical protein J1E37_08925 [Prevotella sp.]|nr:hypothetical protein [Prevotella sp.]